VPEPLIEKLKPPSVSSNATDGAAAIAAVSKTKNPKNRKPIILVEKKFDIILD
jgi:hypothetical protein